MEVRPDMYTARVNRAAARRMEAVGSTSSANQDSPPLADSVLRLTHDLASPLMIIATMGELLLDQPGLTADQRKDVRQILTAVQDAAALVREIGIRAHAARRSVS